MTDDPAGVGRVEVPMKTILLIDDEAQVLGTVGRMLRCAGYKVMEAQGGEEALRLELACWDDIDMVVSDVLMPGLDGPAVVEQLLARRPGLKVLFISGWIGHCDDELPPGASFLQKPFSYEELARAVREVLDGRQPPPGPDDDPAGNP